MADINRPHRSDSDSGLLLHTGVAWSVCLSVCLFVGHVCEPCKNGLTDRDAVWDEDSGGPSEPCIRSRFRSPQGKGYF